MSILIQKSWLRPLLVAAGALLSVSATLYWSRPVERERRAAETVAEASAPLPPAEGPRQEAPAPERKEGLAPPRGEDSKDSARGDAAWQRYLKLMREAEKESLAEAERTLERLKPWFEARKAKAKPLAASVLGLEGKFKLARYIAREVDSDLGWLLQPSPWPDVVFKVDAFADWVRYRLYDELTPLPELQPEVDAALGEYVGRLQEIEARLLVAAGADVPEAEVAWQWSGKAKGASGGALALFDAAKEISKLCRKDLGVTVAREGVAWVAGNALGKQMTREEHSKVRKVLTDLAAGVAADQAVGAGMKAAGYDPEQDIRNVLVRAIDAYRDRTIQGDPQTVDSYCWLRLSWLGHPDAEVSSACRRAMDAMEAHPWCHLGLRVEVEDLHLRRLLACRTRFYRMAFGDDVRVSPFTSDYDTKAVSREAILDYARKVVNSWTQKEKRP